jgi:hypothetical protein
MNMISTGTFQTEMDASNKQESLVSKLTSVWEKKNAKAARAGGVSLMALSLAACGSSDDDSGTAAVDTTETTTTTVTATPINSSLTAGSDSLVGGSGADSFQGLLSGAMAAGSTVQSGDTISGGDGADTATFYISGDAGGAFNLGGIVTTGVETLAISNYDINAGDTTVDMSTMSGVTDVDVINSGATGDTVFSNVQNLVDLTVTGAADVTLTYAATVVAGTADAQTITVDNYTGGLTAASLETINLVASGNNSTVATLAATSATKITVTGDKNLTLTTDLTTSTGSVSVFDASAATGNLTVTSSDATTSILTLGSGDDTLVRNVASNDTGATDSFAGGEGTDTLSVTTGAQATAANLANYSGFERLTITAGSGQTTDLAGVDMFSIIRNTDDTNGTTTVNNIAAGTNLELRGTDTDGDVTALTLANDTLADSMTVTMGSATAGATGALTANNHETISVVSQGGANNLIVTSTGLTTLNASGAQNFTLDTISAAANLATISAGDMTGNFLMDAAEGKSTIAITTGAGNDTVFGQDAGANTISTGAGNDTINNVGGSDTITAGGGADIIVVEDFSDLTSADTIDAGDGSDTLRFSEDADHDFTADATILNGVSNIEKYQFTAIDGDTVTINDTIFNNGAIDIAFTSGIANANTFTAAGVLTSTNTVNFTDDVDTTTYVVGNGIDNANMGGGADIVNVTTEAYLQATDTLSGGLGTDTVNVTLVGGTVAAPDVLSNAVFAGVSGFEVINVDAAQATDYISFTLTDSIVNSNNTSNALELTAEDSAGIAFNGIATFDASAVTSTVALTINGGTLGDTIKGGAGADEIVGGNGADTLTGSGGSDDFQVANDTSMDVITDFSFGTATTAVDQIQFNANFLGNANGAETTADFTAAAKANNGTASVDTGTIAANIDATTDIAIITNTTYAGAAAIDTAVTALNGGIVDQDFVLIYQDTFGNVRLSVVEGDGSNDQAASEFVVTDIAQLTGTTISAVSTLINSGDFIFA